MSCKRIEKIALITITIIFLIWSSIFIYRSSSISIDNQRYFSLFDDAMISMRYAWNLAHGQGLVWNPGERVEGYTNLLLTLLMAIPTALFSKSGAVLSVQIFGVVVMLGIGISSLRITNELISSESETERVLIRCLVYFAVLFYYPLAFWTLMGMETGLLTLLLNLCIGRCLVFLRTLEMKQVLMMGVLSGLAFLTRPDSVLMILILFSYIGWQLIVTHHDRTTLNRLVPGILVFMAIISLQLLFRYSYYGEWVPNTYILKVAGAPLGVRLRGGFDFLKPFIQGIVPIIIFVISDLLFNYRKEKLLFLTAFFISIVYLLYIGGDAWPYWRMTAPVMPLVFILFTFSVSGLILSLTGTSFYRSYFLRRPLLPVGAVPGFLAAILVLGGMVFSNYSFRREILFMQKAYTVGANANNVRIAVALNEVLKPSASVGVTAAGVIPYYLDLKAVDFLGKSDTVIANLPPDISGDIEWRPGHIKYNLDYSIKKLKPTYVETFQWGVQKIDDWAKAVYTIRGYKGVSMRLLEGSPDVNWELLD